MSSSSDFYIKQDAGSRVRYITATNNGDNISVMCTDKYGNVSRTYSTINFGIELLNRLECIGTTIDVNFSFDGSQYNISASAHGSINVQRDYFSPEDFGCYGETFNENIINLLYGSHSDDGTYEYYVSVQN